VVVAGSLATGDLLLPYGDMVVVVVVVHCCDTGNVPRLPNITNTNILI
jgi:hypothetical protein